MQDNVIPSVNVIPEDVALMRTNKYGDVRLRILDALLPHEYFETVGMRIQSLSIANTATVTQMKRFSSQYVPLEDNHLAEQIVTDVVDGLVTSGNNRMQLIQSMVQEIEKVINLIFENVSLDISVFNTRLIFIGLILSVNLGLPLSIENNLFQFITTLLCVYLSGDIVYALQHLYGIQSELLMHNIDALKEKESRMNVLSEKSIPCIRAIRVNTFKTHGKILRRTNIQHRVLFPIILILSVWQIADDEIITSWTLVAFTLYIIVRSILNNWGNVDIYYSYLTHFIFDSNIVDYNGKDTRSLEILAKMIEFKTENLIEVLIEHAFWARSIFYYARYDAYLKRKYKHLRKIELAIGLYDRETIHPDILDTMINIWNTIKSKGIYYVLKFGAKTTPAEIRKTFKNIDDGLDMKDAAVLDCTKVYMFALKIQQLQLEISKQTDIIQNILEPYFPNVANHIAKKVEKIDENDKNLINQLKRNILNVVYNVAASSKHEGDVDFDYVDDYPDGFPISKKLKIMSTMKLVVAIGFLLTIVNFPIVIAFDAVVSVILAPFLIPVLITTLIDALSSGDLTDNSYTDRVAEATTTLLYPKVGSKVHKVTRLLINKASAMKLRVLENKRKEIHEYVKRRGNWADNDDISETSNLTFKLN